LIVSDQELQRNNCFSKPDLDWIITKKKLTQFYTLVYSGRQTELALNLLDEAICFSEVNEHYIVLLECLRFKKWMTGLRNGIEHFEKIEKKIKHYDFCSKVVSAAVDLYYKSGIGVAFGHAGNINRRVLLKGELAKLKRKNKMACSRVATYYIGMIEVDYLMKSNDYSKARKILLTLIPFVRSNKAVFREQRVGSLLCNLSRCELFLSNFKNAAEFADQAAERFQFGTANYFIAQEQKLYSLFYKGRISEADEIVEMLINKSMGELGGFRYSKFTLFKAHIHFNRRKYADALAILTKVRRLSEDKPGWDIAIRFLKIMCYIELGKKDTASSMIETLRRHINFYSSRTEFYMRFKLIVTFFKALDRNGFAFENFTREMEALLAQLAEKNKKHSWRLLGPELIPIHKWALEKTSGLHVL
jgi:tetratricopeptide (TPR) repeat protein